MLTKQQLEEIAERANKATEGPWGVEFGAVTSEHANTEMFLGEKINEVCSLNDGEYIINHNEDNDATFIANAREDVPKLLEHIAEQETEIERLRNQERVATELYKIVLWTTRRLPQSYKPMVYDWIDEATRNESERV